ncbi:hypothetical protein SI65_06711 [Aspergillus cristatus]|uniref:Protein kinase domain-containing protein n=1 Tax=Aspergillus cristatus TaxID=573508 RepID=A0A1E3BAA4_ASPCR|nr:hypothetical protein SI65_06711 [Aspergillus cristatus]
MVLKVFDRLSASQARTDEKADPWTLDIEQRYHQFLLDSGESDSSGEDGNDEDGEGNDDEDGVDYSDDEEDEEEDGEKKEQKGWIAPRYEADLHNLMHRLHRTEAEAYQALKDRQGEDIPRFLACITIPSSSPMQEESLIEHVDMPGILLQNINGFHLADLAQHAPRETWQFICEDAIRVTNLLYNRGILNKDVKTRNLIVRKALKGNFKVFMIDFALCRFRREYKSDNNWRVKHTKTERVRWVLSCRGICKEALPITGLLSMKS